MAKFLELDLDFLYEAVLDEEMGPSAIMAVPSPVDVVSEPSDATTDPPKLASKLEAVENALTLTSGIPPKI